MTRPSTVAGKPASNAAATAFRKAIERFCKAEFSDAVSLLLPWAERPGEPEHLSLIARALMHLRRHDDALLFANRSLKAAKDDSSRSIASALLATALRRLGRVSEAEQAFEDAQTPLAGASAAAQAEVAYLRAAALWEDGREAEAENLVERALDSAEGARAARLLQLRGWIEVRKESYRTAAEDFLDALDCLADSGQDDVLLRARILYALGSIACETIDLRLGRQVRELNESLPRKPAIARERFGTLSCLRYLSMLEGDLDAAWRSSAQALEVAPSPAFKSIAATNVAVLAGIVGDAFSMRMNFEDAWTAIERADWTVADEDARVGLTNFVVEAAFAFSSETRKAITLYQSVAGRPDSRNILHGDRRMRAFDAMAVARICEAMGKSAEAIAHYQEALRLLGALDYKMRAAIVALDLFRLTRDEKYLDEYYAALRRAPSAWFRKTLSASEQASTPAAPAGRLPRLTPGQRRVLSQLLLGKSSRAAAESLGLSIFTIHNHSRKLFEAFQVQSRSQLLVRCAELSLAAGDVAEGTSTKAAPAARPLKVPRARRR